VLPEIGAAPIEKIPLDLKAEPLAARIQYANALGENLRSDAVAGKRRDAIVFHATILDHAKKANGKSLRRPGPVSGCWAPATVRAGRSH
jgi:hypothetical protein